MRLALLGVLSGSLVACSGPGAVTPVRAICPGSARLVAQAQVLVDSVLTNGVVDQSRTREALEADALLGVATLEPVRFTSLSVKPELITDRRECEAAAHEILHSPTDVRDLVAFRYGEGYIIVYDGPDDARLMLTILVVDGMRQPGPGIVWIGTGKDR